MTSAPARQSGGSSSEIGPPAGASPSAGETSRLIRSIAPSEAAALPPDDKLVARALSGDERAFGRLVERYQGLLMLIAFRRAGRASECEDIVQEAFVRAYRALATLERPDRFRSWIARIASNVALDRVRRRSPVVSFDQDSGLIEALPAGRSPRPSARIQVEEERRRLIEAIERLPGIYQVPVVLRHVEGLPYRDIARRLGLREDALRKRIHRASVMLRRDLSEKKPPPREAGDGGPQADASRGGV